MFGEIPTRRVVVTGPRHWSDQRRVFGALRRELEHGGEFLLGVGDCPTGADHMALWWGRKRLVWPVTVFCAPWTQRGKAAGPIRNHFMIDLFRPGLVLAFVGDQSRGTKDCADYAEAKGITVRRFSERGDYGEIAEVDRSADGGVRGGAAQAPGEATD